MSHCSRQTLLLFAVTLAAVFLVATLAWADNQEASVWAWKRWKDISRVIELRPLDDPSDILEKAEIIDDRIDELTREKSRLEKWLSDLRRQDQTLREQRSLMQELGEMNQGGDFQTRQRIHELTDRISQGEGLIAAIRKSLDELQAETNRLRVLSAEYRRVAEQLRLRENVQP
jgi:prefoldin subunit 5